MKAVILAGGLGTRLSEETQTIPKPMVQIGGKPIIWHIMNIYSAHGINDFIICLGYKGYVIKEYFANYFLHMSDVTFDLCRNEMTVHNNYCENWKVTLVDTGRETQTGGRLKRVSRYLNGETFCFTYGDGVADIDITALISFHKSHGKAATVTSVKPPGRFGALRLNGETVTEVVEKPENGSGWINGGFFVLEPEVLSYINGDETVWERAPMEALAGNGELISYQHKGFWQPMDTLREKNYLESLCQHNKAPWIKINEADQIIQKQVN